MTLNIREHRECKKFIAITGTYERSERWHGFSCKLWRPRRDLNPCYRRESRPRVRN